MQNFMTGFLRRKLHEAGFMVEEMTPLVPELHSLIPASLYQKPDHPFFGFARSLRIIANMESLPPQKAKDLVLRDPRILFEIHDMEPGAEIENRQKKIAKADAPAGTEDKKRATVSLDDVLASARATVAKTFERPKTGPVEYGPLAGRDWKSIAKEIAALDGSGQPLTTLRRFFEHHGIYDSMDLEPVLESAKLAYAETGSRRFLKGAVEHGPLKGRKTWPAINVGIARIHRNDPSFPSSVKALLDEHKIGLRKKAEKKKSAAPPPAALSYDDIIASAKETVEETNLRPVTGKVEYGPLKGRNWGKVRIAVYRAARRNAAAPYASLKELLDKNKIYNRPDVAAILESAKETYRGAGSRGVFRGAVEHGPLKGKTTWERIGFHLRKYAEIDPAYTAHSLAAFLNAHGIGLTTSKLKSKLALTPELILEAARLTLQETGEPPAFADGRILHGRLAGLASWRTVNEFLKEYAAGHKDCGYINLRTFLKFHGVEKPFPVADILESARATLRKTGRRPALSTSLIKYGPLKDKTSWRTVDKYIAGHAARADGFAPSLHALLDRHLIHNKGDFPTALIVESALATIGATGRRPTKADGKIEYGPLKGLIRWDTINDKIRAEAAAQDNPEFSSLAGLLDLRGVFTKAAAAPRTRAPRAAKAAKTIARFALDDILASARAFHAREGMRPHRRAGAVEDGPLKGKTRWFDVDLSLREDARENPALACSSLMTLMEHHQIGPQKPARPEKPAAERKARKTASSSIQVLRGYRGGPISAAYVWAAVAYYIGDHAELPDIGNDDTVMGGLRMGHVAQAFKDSAVRDQGYYMPRDAQPAACLKDFMIASKLAEEKDGQLVLGPQWTRLLAEPRNE